MKYNGSNLKEVLEAHQRWFDGSDGWTDDDRADLRGADLCGANLCEAKLRAADLNGANLNGANLCKADLYGAYLCGANLSKANLSAAHLYGADLRGAYLYGANLSGAYLCRVDLRGADLHGADLSETHLLGADMSGANLCGADLRKAKNALFIHMACPDSGDFIGWKKCILKGKAATKHGVQAIIKLLIPSDADRSSAAGRKCRASYAKVLEVQTLDGTLIADDQTEMDGEAVSIYDYKTIYTPGEEVRPEKPFDPDRWNECASGIHFFINRQEAVDY